MSHPLQQQVRAVARRSRRLLLLYGVSSFLGVVLLAAFAAGLADYVLRFRDHGVRIILSGSIAVLLAWSFARFVAPAMLRRYSNLQVARYIERRFPELRDRLSSSIEFLEQAEGAAGSADLRRQLVAEASSLTARLDLLDSIDSAVPRRVFLGLLLGVVVLGSLCLFDQRSSWLAARRLAVPWSDDAWPRRNSLAFADPPRRIAVGQDFEIELIDRQGRLPEEVLAEYWFEGDDAAQTQSRQMKRLGDRMVDQLANVTRSFRVRAAGGDDDTMDWHTVEAVQPPRVSEFEILVRPPEYTGLPDDRLGRHLRLVAGTRITLIAGVNKPLKSVRWHGTIRHEPEMVTARLAQDGLSFSWPAEPFVARESGTFWFELTDREGVSNDLQLRCELQVVQDSPPTVSIESPDSSAVLTPRAVVPLKAVVKDDLEIDTITLHFGDHQIRLEPPQPDPALGGPRGAAVPGDLRVVEYAWDLGALTELTPGESIEFHVAASDFKPQLGRSETRRLSIVSSDEFERRSDQRRSMVRKQLAEALRVQRSARLQVRSLLVQLKETGQLRDADVELLQSTEMQQRTVRSVLENSQDGVRTLVQSLLTDARSNRVEPGPIEREMTSLSQQIDQLAEQHLGSIEQALRDALGEARVQPVIPGRGGPRLRSRLTETGSAQDAVAALLEQLLDEFDQRGSFRQFSREIARIRSEQESLRIELRDVDTFGRRRDDLSSEQTAKLKRLALLQRELGRQFDRLQGTMQDVADSLHDSDPAISTTLERALQVARSGAVGGLMREAAASVENNQLGHVGELQQRIQDGLRGLMDALSNRDPAQPSGTLRQTQLARLEPQLLELISRQQTAATTAAQLFRARAAQEGQLSTDQVARLRQLASEQHVLGQETTALAETVEDAEVFAFGLQSAGREMLRAGQRLRREMMDSTTSNAQASALGHLRRLLEALRQTTRSPGGQPGEAARQAPQSVALRPSELKLLKRMQQEINRRTAEVHQLRADAGGLTEELRLELQHLTAEQGRLAAVVLRLGRSAATNRLP